MRTLAGTALKANDHRADHLRAALARADALILRPTHAPAIAEEDAVEVLLLAGRDI